MSASADPAHWRWPSAPFQAYSWMAFPHREEILVQSFCNYREYDGESLDGIADLPESEQRRRFGGTLAPTVRLAVSDGQTRIRGRLGHWHIPLPSEPLPDTHDEPPADVDAADDTRPNLDERPRFRPGPYSGLDY